MIVTPQRCGAIALAGTVLVAATGASGQIVLSDPVLRFEASNAQGSGFIEVPFNPGAAGPDGSYFWFLAGPPLQITDGPNVIAEITQASISAGNLPNKALGVGFTVFAGDSTTTFSVTSALSTFSAQNPGEARASNSVSITDSAGTPNGATVLGLRPGGTVASALINGLSAGTGDTFYNMNTGPFVTNTTITDDDESAPAPNFLPTVPVSSMTLAWDFSLTQGDQYQNTTLFFAVPTPATALVLAGGAFVLRRRR